MTSNAAADNNMIHANVFIVLAFKMGCKRLCRALKQFGLLTMTLHQALLMPNMENSLVTVLQWVFAEEQLDLRAEQEQEFPTVVQFAARNSQ